MSRHRNLFAAISLLLAAPGVAAAHGPVGLWWTKGQEAVVAIEPCGEALCGRLVGLPREAWEPIPLAVDGRSQCGLTIIHGEKPDEEGGWRGWISDPRSGSNYRARLSMDRSGGLRVHGYLLIPALGRTQVWTRFTGHVDSSCQVSPSAIASRSGSRGGRD